MDYEYDTWGNRLADKLQQHAQIPFTAQEYADMERLEEDLRAMKLSERSHGGLEFADVPVQLMAAQLDPLPVVNIRRVHLYQCDYLGTPTSPGQDHVTPFFCTKQFALNVQ